MTTLPPETSVEELSYMFRTALMKGERSGCHSEATSMVQGVVNRVVELLTAVLQKDWKMVDGKTTTITKGVYPIANRVVTQARMLVKANQAGTALLKRLVEGSEYLNSVRCVEPPRDPHMVHTIHTRSTHDPRTVHTRSTRDAHPHAVHLTSHTRPRRPTHCHPRTSAGRTSPTTSK